MNQEDSASFNWQGAARRYPDGVGRRTDESYQQHSLRPDDAIGRTESGTTWERMGHTLSSLPLNVNGTVLQRYI